MFPFPLYENLLVGPKCAERGAFQVLTDNYVKEEDGTGVVHQAPYFGAVSNMLTFITICQTAALCGLLLSPSKYGTIVKNIFLTLVS